MKYEDGHESFDEQRVLEGLNVLDVGCGGGLLSEVIRHPTSCVTLSNLSFRVLLVLVQTRSVLMRLCLT